MFVSFINLVMHFNLNVAMSTSDIAAVILLFMKFTNIYCHTVFCYQWVRHSLSLLLYNHLIIHNSILHILNDILNTSFFFKIRTLWRHGFTNALIGKIVRGYLAQIKRIILALFMPVHMSGSTVILLFF